MSHAARTCAAVCSPAADTVATLSQNRTTPIVSRVFVYCGSDLLRPEMPPAAGHYCERVEVAPDGDCGLRVKFTGRDSAIGLCSTLQVGAAQSSAGCPQGRVLTSCLDLPHVHHRTFSASWVLHRACSTSQGPK